jgi:hypothetical protein
MKIADLACASTEAESVSRLSLATLLQANSGIYVEACNHGGVSHVLATPLQLPRGGQHHPLWRLGSVRAAVQDGHRPSRPGCERSAVRNDDRRRALPDRGRSDPSDDCAEFDIRPGAARTVAGLRGRLLACEGEFHGSLATLPVALQPRSLAMP